ncbi:MAG TPA: hypothetical protein VIC33_15090 [Vicinamibacterales bacterium]|jgi:uncharacterized spore protein YtfJ
MNPQEVLVNAQQAMNVRRVFGDPIQVDGATVIPAAVVGGGGGGAARGESEGGVGFGLKAKPAGAFVVKDGRVAWRPAIDVNRIVLGGQIVAITAILVLGPALRAWCKRGKS